MTLLRMLSHSALATTAVAAFAIPLSPESYPATAVAQTADDEVLASGRFSGADRSHRASGSARIVRLADGDLVVRFEDFSVTGGPDLRVWVTDAPRIPNARAARRASHVDLGRLRRNRGDQSYRIPVDALDGEYRSVVIWCRAFGVLFASAPLS